MSARRRMRVELLDADQVALQWQGQQWSLLGAGALYWPAEGLLAVADLHLGREQQLRAAGLPWPGSASNDDLVRLGGLLQRWQPRLLALLGDVLHAPTGPGNDHWIGELARLAAAANCRLCWLLGNHDPQTPMRGSAAWPANIELGHRLLLRGVTLAHEPDSGAQRAVAGIYGHLHPMLRWRDRHDRLRLPSFLVEPDCLLLPAFSSLAGGLDLPVRGERQFYPIAAGRILARVS